MADLKINLKNNRKYTQLVILLIIHPSVSIYETRNQSVHRLYPVHVSVCVSSEAQQTPQ